MRIAITAALASSCVRIWLALRYHGFQTGDDVEIAEEAFRRALGMTHGPWDIRSLLIPDMLVAPFVWVAHFAGVRDLFALSIIARLPFILLAAVNIVLLYILGKRWFNETTGSVAAVLYAMHWIPYVYASSLYPRTIAVTCILGAAILLDRDRALLAGVLAALAMTARYSEAVFIVSLLVIAARAQRRALIAGFTLGTIVFVGLYDWLTWGVPFGSLVKFAELVFIRGDASSVVVFQPPYWYLSNLPHWLALTAILLIVVSARTQWRRLVAFVVIPLVAFSVIFHKELRYLQVILPFALLFAAHGFAIWEKRKLAMAMLALSIPLGLTRIGIVEKRSTNAVDAARWIAAQHPRAIMLPQAWAYGGRLFFGNGPSINDPGSPPTPRELREILPTVDCAAMYTSDAVQLGFPRQREFAGRGGRAVSVSCRSSGGTGAPSPIPTPR